MKKTHQKRLARLAIALLRNYEDGHLVPPTNRKMVFRMSWWAYDIDGDRVHQPSEVHTCGTSCCFLGYAPIVMPATRKLDDWEDVTRWVVGAGTGELVDFLFGANWPSIPREAAARALYALRQADKKDPFYPSYTYAEECMGKVAKMKEATLIRELSKFL